ncbi:MAG: thiol reductant ABC exporter subunit CydD, partial [Streptococcaceae bacterium]|nr:thiol reductant ABC exporter subunit CydD [Streptococcaceae bacterium]
MAKLVGFSALQACCVLSQAIFLTRGIFGFWNGEKNQLFNALFFLLSYCVRHFLSLGKEGVLEKFAMKESLRLQKELLQVYLRMGSPLIRENGSGKAVHLAIDGIQQVKLYIQLSLSKLISIGVLPILLFAVLIYFDKWSAFAMFLVYPIVVLFMIILGKTAQAKAEKQYANFQMYNNHFLDTLRGLKTLRILGISKKYANSIYHSSEETRKSTMQTLRIAILSTFTLDFFTTLSTALVATFLGLRLISGSMTLFPALLVLILSPEFFLPLREFAADYHASINGKNAFNEIHQRIQELDSEKSEPEISIGQSLSFENISVEIEGEKILEEISFHVLRGEKIGIVGRSGSGKSTLISYLIGLREKSEGSVRSEGREIPTFLNQKWKKQVFLIPQKTSIIRGSLKENLLLYSTDGDESNLDEAIRQSGLESFIQTLPNGVEEQIGQGIREVSGGQKQRIAIARTLLTERREFLFLDEPTAHLDAVTEVELKENIHSIFSEKTVFFATHRLHWMKEMDKILVLEDGRLVGFDTHEALL